MSAYSDLSNLHSSVPPVLCGTLNCIQHTEHDFETRDQQARNEFTTRRARCARICRALDVMAWGERERERRRKERDKRVFQGHGTPDFDQESLSQPILDNLMTIR